MDVGGNEHEHDKTVGVNHQKVGVIVISLSWEVLSRHEAKNGSIRGGLRLLFCLPHSLK